jgi:hypothetical protein
MQIASSEGGGEGQAWAPPVVEVSAAVPATVAEEVVPVALILEELETAEAAEETVEAIDALVVGTKVDPLTPKAEAEVAVEKLLGGVI